MKKVLLFDFDGTIADSFESFLTIVSRIAKKYNLPVLTRSQLEELRLEGARSVIKKLKIPFYMMPFIARDMKKMQQEEISNIKVFKDVRDVLIKLKKLGYTLGILTSNGKENVTQFVKNNDLDVFDYLYCGATLFGKDKVIRTFLKENNVMKEQVIYIGDEIRDIEACRKIGVPIIGVTWGFNSKTGLMNSHPDFVVDKPSELLDVLKIDIS